MVTIYTRTSCGYLQLFPYTSEGQFKSHAAAHAYLRKLNRPYNGSCLVVTQMSYEKANRIYMEGY